MFISYEGKKSRKDIDVMNIGFLSMDQTFKNLNLNVLEQYYGFINVRKTTIFVIFVTGLHLITDVSNILYGY